MLRCILGLSLKLIFITTSDHLALWRSMLDPRDRSTASYELVSAVVSVYSFVDKKRSPGDWFEVRINAWARYSDPT